MDPRALSQPLPCPPRAVLQHDPRDEEREAVHAAREPPRRHPRTVVEHDMEVTGKEEDYEHGEVGLEKGRLQAEQIARDPLGHALEWRAETLMPEVAISKLAGSSKYMGQGARW